MKRYLIYLKVVLWHKWFVFRSCLRLGVPLWIALVHDWRKFLPREFFPYARNFYNIDGTKRKIRDATGAYNPAVQNVEFQLAWLDHQRARHHWQSWCVIGDSGKLSPQPMPEVFVREMIADWMGAGLAYDNYDPHGWYAVNAKNMILANETKKMIENIMASVEVPRIWL